MRYHFLPSNLKILIISSDFKGMGKKYTLKHCWYCQHLRVNTLWSSNSISCGYTCVRVFIAALLVIVPTRPNTTCVHPEENKLWKTYSETYAASTENEVGHKDWQGKFSRCSIMWKNSSQNNIPSMNQFIFLNLSFYLNTYC